MCASSDEQISGVVETNKRDFGYATRFNFMRLIRTILLQRFNESVHPFIIITWPVNEFFEFFFFFFGNTSVANKLLKNMETKRKKRKKKKEKRRGEERIV